MKHILSQVVCVHGIAIVCLLGQPVWAIGKPNVVVIIADYLGYGDLSCQGATKVHTQHIDILPAE